MPEVKELPLDEISKYETRIPLDLIRKDEKVYLERLTREIGKEGITEPITIRVREDGSRIVWDGLHRLIVAQNLGIKNVPVEFIGEEANPPAFEEGKKGGNPMTQEEIDQVANKVAAKVLDEITPTVLDPAGRGILLHFTEHEMVGSGLLVNEAKARATPCSCFTYNDREYCFSKGIIGMMSSAENPEQIAEYCKVGKTYEVKPGIKERFESFAGAAEVAHKKIEEIPKGEKLVPWLSAMGEELEKRGIEV